MDKLLTASHCSIQRLWYTCPQSIARAEFRLQFRLMLSWQMAHWIPRVGGAEGIGRGW